MYLAPDDRKKLLEALDEAFPEVADFEALAFYHLNVSLEKVTDSPTRKDRVMMGLIQWAENGDRVPDLLVGARTLNPGNRLLEVVAAAITEKIKAYAPAYRARDPFLVCLPRLDLPFVDRSGLRRTLRAMIDGGGKAILAVQGDARMGKTHTSHLISYLANNVRDADGNHVYKTVAIHLADYSPNFDAGDFAEQVALQLSRPQSGATIPRRPESEQESRWEGRVASWILGEVRDAVRQSNLQQVWLVVDGFQQTAVGQSTRDLLRRLANQAHYHVPEMRVILLDHPDAIPDMERFIERDRIGWPAKDDVEEFFRQVVAGTGRTIDDELLGRLTDATWDDAGPLETGFMERLDCAIQSRLPTLLGR
jgi:hypothetical protein